MVSTSTTTSLTLAQPNFHYPIPTSFETSSTWPHGLGVCGATNNNANSLPPDTVAMPIAQTSLATWWRRAQDRAVVAGAQQLRIGQPLHEAVERIANEATAPVLRGWQQLMALSSPLCIIRLC